MRTKWNLIVATVVLSSALAGCENSAQEFRIETDIFVDNSEKPVSENLTLFTASKVYDFQLAKSGETPIEIVVYDFENRSFALLDPSRKVKYEIDSEQLAYFVKSLRDDADMRKRMPFLFEPQLSESFDENAGWLTLKSLQVEYRCKGKTPKNNEAMARYYDFVDQYAQLNVTDPQKLPPFARLELNKAIKAKQWMPNTVEMKLDLSTQNGARKINAKSKHYVIWKLSKKDNGRIETATAMLNEFESVGLEKYRNLR